MIRIVLTTTDSEEKARELARTLVSERLAACVNIIPKVTSVYKWKGEIEEETELLLLVKTTPERLDSLTARLQEIHSYDVPEVVVVPVEGGLADYLKWVETETRSENVT